jgi:CheY-like chemotaxis protein
VPTRRVLVVDDQREIREMGKIALGLGTGWEVLTASSGAEALSIATAEHVDAILLDVMMPDMDGPATLERLRTQPSTRAIPVVFLTAEERSLGETGVAGTITKPFNPVRLASHLAEVLGWTT